MAMSVVPMMAVMLVVRARHVYLQVRWDGERQIGQYASGSATV